MRIIQYVLPILLCATVLSSCGDCSRKTQDCPGFHDEELTAWFPYSDNQKLTFQSSSNEQDIFTLKNVTTTGPYKGPGPVCSAQNIFQSLEKDANEPFNFSIGLYTYSSNNIIANRNVSIDIGPCHLVLNDLKDTGFAIVNINYVSTSIAHVPSVTLGGSTYSNVIAATVDTTKEKYSCIYKVYYSKNKGLIGWEEYPTLKTWGIQ